MLGDARLPHRFWAEALSTAVYLQNRSPPTAVEGKTPFEAWTGRKPNVGHLRVFGCAACAHVAKDERQKLGAKSRKCVVLDYGTERKGYRLYDPRCERVFYSRDVVFDESSRGIEKEQSVPERSSERCVELDFHDDEKHVADKEHTTEEGAEPVVRRSNLEKKAPDYYGDWASVTNAELTEPTTVKYTLSSPDKAKWMSAMKKEIESLQKNDVWELVDLPKRLKAVGSKWVFNIKTDAEGSVERFKARLVAQGLSQKPGIDYDDTFSPVARFESVRTVIALAMQNDLKLHQIDVTTAFLYGDLKDEVYMRQPEGFVVKGQEYLVCKLKRSIYGLKQSRSWNSVLDQHLKKVGFVQSVSDPCIYVASEGEMFMIAVHVDDLVLAAKSDKRIGDVKKALSDKFEVKDVGELRHFLGTKVLQNKQNEDLWIGQPAYTPKVLCKFYMENAKAVDTPVDAGSKLVKMKEDSESADREQFQSAVGTLLYLSTMTRPDITYALSNVAKFCANPDKEHWIAVKRIMRYLVGTMCLGLLYKKNELKSCVGFSDADWAGDLDDRKSTSGYIFQLSGEAISWRSKKQACVALSTAEAEYIALASAAQEAVWMRQLLTDLRRNPEEATRMYEDNQSAICLAKNPQFHGRPKHISSGSRWRMEMELSYCRTEEMVAQGRI